MQDKELSKKIFSGMKWKALERIFLQVVNAVTPMVLARFLIPEDYGTVAILTVFISLANTFVNNGLCNAIIQKKESDNLDCSTVFYTQLAIALVCYMVLFASAPFIADFYDDSNLILMLRVMSLSVIIGSVGSMQTTMMKKNMLFNKSFIIYGTATVAYGITGIVMAYMGFGSWSLVFASLANSFFTTIVAVIVIKWKPVLDFSFNRLKMLFSYSWKLAVGWIIGTIHQDIYTLVIGKRFSGAILGYYNRAGSFPHIITKTVTEVVDGVMFPALSKIQDDKSLLKSMSRNMISANSYILFPAFLGLVAVSENLVHFILTEKWLPCVPMMKIMCITFAFNSLNNSNMQIFNSIGRSDIFMKFEMIKRAISIVLMLAMSFISIYAVIAVLLLMALVSNIMNSYQNNKQIGYTYFEFTMDVVPYFVMALIMAIITMAVSEFLNIPLLLEMCIQVVTGAVVYILLSLIFKPKAFKTLYGVLKNKIKVKTHKS